MDMEKEVSKILLEKNLSFLEQVASTTMTWWVSSIVFCPTIIAVFWYYRDNIVKLPILMLHFVCTVIFIFFLSLPVYAVWLVYGLVKIEKETKILLQSLGIKSNPPFSFKGVRCAIIIGGSCFLFTLVLWCIVWYYLA